MKDRASAKDDSCILASLVRRRFDDMRGDFSESTTWTRNRLRNVLKSRARARDDSCILLE